ncbi:hypothetical protein FHL15_006154 [Xylaria flabelliformis]|uniref:Uncharacterized protein n=1 Tax=Xylaria flabelliformis TaxID=2512241 RepID=A0A553HYI6_9PEZI|nr:hypothetical protein FHL15_006154 [Xylaria flabelliformis]
MAAIEIRQRKEFWMRPISGGRGGDLMAEEVGEDPRGTNADRWERTASATRAPGGGDDVYLLTFSDGGDGGKSRAGRPTELPWSKGSRVRPAYTPPNQSPAPSNRIKTLTSAETIEMSRCVVLGRRLRRVSCDRRSVETVGCGL